MAYPNDVGRLPGRQSLTIVLGALVRLRDGPMRGAAIKPAGDMFRKLHEQMRDGKELKPFCGIVGLVRR